MHRRDFVRFSGIAVAGGVSGQLKSGYASNLESLVAGESVTSPDVLAEDDAFWMRVRGSYVTTADLVDLDNANTAPTPVPVFEGYVRHGRRLRHAPAEGFGKMWDDQVQVARKRLAAYLGADPARLVFTLNATVALNTVLHGFPLERGDEVLVTDHEYPDMIETIQQRVRREGIVLRVVKVPTPSEGRLALADRVASAVSPRTRLMLLSHVSAWSGEVLPIREVTAVARAKGVAVLIDAAQSVGLLDVDFRQIGCDFLGTSLHKWLSAPMGTGALLMRPEHFGKVVPLHPPSWDTTKYPTDLYEWTGTFNIAAYAAVADALDFLLVLGPDRKRARVRHLGQYWQAKVAEVPGVTILTPRDGVRSFGIASMMIDEVSSDTLAKHLRTKGLLVQDKAGRHSPFRNAIRVSPGVYATHAELDRFVSAIRNVAKNGIPGVKA